MVARKQITGGLPFDMKLPSERLKQAIKEANKGEVEEFNNINELIKDL